MPAAVSVVVPFFNQVGMTLSCVRALERARAFNRVTFEIVLVNDASTEELGPLAGTTARMVHNPVNVGYLHSTNNGVARSSGKYVLLLNNDTEPIGAFLDPLVDLLERRSDAAMVGARLVYPDGRLQEAGSIIFSDGSGWNVGRGHDPFHPFYAFERPVRYCSAAALLVRRAFWDEVGGFDARYAPAYYEDTDLAMEAWSRGREVWYQPASTVIHFEGASHGTDSNPGLKRYQERNRHVFVEKWESTLRTLPAPDPSTVLANRWASRRGHVIVVDNEAPRPDRDAGSLRIVSLMQILIDEGFSVTFCAHNNSLSDRERDGLSRSGVEAWGDPGTWRDHLATMVSAASFVWLSRPNVANTWLRFMRDLLPGVPIVFDTVDLHSVRQSRQRDVLGVGSLVGQELVSEEFELGLAREADVAVVVSEAERNFLAERGVERVAVIPTVHRTVNEPVRRSGRALEALFVGGFRHPPNADAVEWFVRSVLPLVRAELPAFQFRIVGADLTEDLRRRLQSEGVILDGYLPSLDAVYRSTGLVVAPLRFGAGVKGKVGEAMSHGVPLVVTSVAAEGFGEFRAGIVADDAVDFARAVVDLLIDDAMWRECAERGIEDIERLMSTQSVGRMLREDLFPRLGLSREQ